MSDRLTAWVRTVVPGLWSALISLGLAWAASKGLPPVLTDALTAAGGLGDILIVPLVLAGVYALLRWLEPRVPSWLAAVLLGSSRQPTYPPAAPQLRRPT